MIATLETESPLLSPNATASAKWGFSVGICTSDSDRNLEELMTLIEAESFPNGYVLERIVVVASHCNAATLSYLRTLSEADGRVVLVEETVRNGKAAAINRIVERYDGDFLVMVNGDALPSRGAIGRLLLSLSADDEAGMVAGRPIFEGRGDSLSRVLELMWTVHNDCSHQLNHAGVSNQCSDEMVAARSDVVRQLPLGVVNDGAFLAGAAYSRGYGIRFCSEASVRIDVPKRFADLIRQRRRIIFGHLQVWKLVGRAPRTIETLLLTSPKTSLKILVRTLARAPQLILALPIAAVIEAMSMITAVSDSARSTKKHAVWKRHGI